MGRPITITAKDLNDLCSKDVCAPVSIYDQSAYEVSQLLTMQHRIVRAADIEGIVSESNNYVTVVENIDLITERDFYRIKEMITMTRWRKALLIPFSTLRKDPGHRVWMLEEQAIINRCIHINLEG